MQKTPRKKRCFSESFKLKLMREIESGKSRAQISREHEVDEVQLCRWYKEYRTWGENAFNRKNKKNSEAVTIAELERLVGRLCRENDMLKQASSLLETKLSQLRRMKD